jgi:tartrate-resistant acid phosphatase type 5
LRRLALLLAVVLLAHCKRRAPEEPPPTRTVELAPRAASSAVAEESSAAFDAAPSAGSVRFAIIGDYGADTVGEAAVAALVKSWRPDFIVTLGDNNYPAGEAATIDVNIGRHYAEFIGNYRGRFGKGSSENRFWPSPGNHDWIVGLAPYLEYFTLPGNERYYDVDRGLVHLYALDSDHREPDGISVESRQAGWLKERLAASTACYDIVYFHHPSYSTSEHGSALPLRWPFRKWGAEVVLAGHDHTYERLEVDGIPYFVNGLGGASKYDFPVAALAETKFRYNEEFGAMRVIATSAQIVYEFFTIDGKKRDALTMPGTCR